MMEDNHIPSLWTYSIPDSNHDPNQLGEKLLWNQLELEKLKSEVVEEMQKHKEHIRHLIALLRTVIRERDDAKIQLEKMFAAAGAATDFSLEANDRASAVVDALAWGRPLPQQGKLLQAVLDAGPLLQTLLLAGPLPRWRNPPAAVAVGSLDGCSRGMCEPWAKRARLC